MSTVLNRPPAETYPSLDDHTFKPQFPGIPTTSDGAGMVVWVETHITQGACAYPITSSTTMGGGYQVEVANGKRNLWGDELAFIEPESEHSAATSCEGFAVAGGRVTNFTSGQGLILMKEVLYTISGKRLPVVFHIGARALTSQSLNVHTGHDDVVGVADCGWGVLYARNAQEAGDYALIARRTAEDTETPFLNVQDGFLTTHTIENVLLPEPDLMRQYAGNPAHRLRNLMDPQIPLMSGVVQNQDSYMKGKIAQRRFYDQVMPALKKAMQDFYLLTGRRYDVVLPYRLEDADYAIVGSGCMLETAEAAVDYMRDKLGLKVGLLHITSFRPFPSADIVRALRHVKAIAVIERLDIPLMQSNPQLCELKAAFADAMSGAPGYPTLTRMPKFSGGSAGLGSRDVRAGDFIAIIENLRSPQTHPYFTVGVKHSTALPVTLDPDVRDPGSFSMRGHSVGGYGSVTTNKIIATIGGEVFGMDVQAYPKYGSEKKGLPTTYYLTIARQHIRVHSELEHVEFVALNDVNAFNLENPLMGLSQGGMVFVQSPSADPAEIWRAIPAWARQNMCEKNARLFALDTVGIAQKVSSRADLQQRMQGIVLLGIFLRITPFQTDLALSEEEVFRGAEKSLRKYFGKRGERVVQDNLEAVRRGYHEVIQVPREVMLSTAEADKANAALRVM
ncbi:MAG TPA: 2-oxoacid:acceptor oxidoreductase family protein [Candidatus Acidoferrales bacterium]|nr:2-oxoacid:acceptor oxidoreductase family protein [Candidatus Acidoferrales bacterium]